MRITDINLNIGSRDNNNQVVNINQLLDLMQEYHISHGVCYNTYAKLDPKEGNSAMAQLSMQTGGKIGVCAVLDPVLGADNLPGEGDLKERLKQFAPEALRIFPDEARVPFHPLYWEEILDAANALRLPLIIDGDYSKDLFALLPDVSMQYPQVKFILLRLGLCSSRLILPLITKRDNIYFTIEKMNDYMQLEEICEANGCGKLLFGSGYPRLPYAGMLGLALYAE
ncbi:MAG: hypothetical protein IIU86_05695, partial [Oscillospiraceae bacterium]|nr:hypothetical protein [Oscillospiraceae bacterium]